MDDVKLEKFWVTTYALTKGVMVLEMEDRGGYACRMDRTWDLFEKIGLNAFRTQAEAGERNTSGLKSGFQGDGDLALFFSRVDADRYLRGVGERSLEEGRGRRTEARGAASLQVPAGDGEGMSGVRSEVEDEALRVLSSKARGILERVREGGSVLVRSPDEVAVARALRRAGATDVDMRRIRFTHDPTEE